MAFKAITYSPDEAYREIKRISRLIDILAKQAIADLAGDMDSDQIVGLGYRLKDHDAELSAVLANADVPELIQYAQDQEGDQSYNVQTEYNAMSAQIDAVMTWIQTNFPANGGFLLAHSFGANGLTARIFPPASTAGLLTEMTTLDDLIV